MREYVDTRTHAELLMPAGYAGPRKAVRVISMLIGNSLAPPTPIPAPCHAMLPVDPAACHVALRMHIRRPGPTEFVR